MSSVENVDGRLSMQQEPGSCIMPQETLNLLALTNDFQVGERSTDPFLNFQQSSRRFGLGTSNLSSPPVMDPFSSFIGAGRRISQQQQQQQAAAMFSLSQHFNSGTRVQTSTNQQPGPGVMSPQQCTPTLSPAHTLSPSTTIPFNFSLNNSASLGLTINNGIQVKVENEATSSCSQGDLKRRKGPVPRMDIELCLVCGDKASGFHYNALSCEGCKGFFRRSITKNAVYKCTRGGNCEMDMYMRRKCQECRLRKCREVGMLPECLLTEEQCRSKRQRRMLKQQQQQNYEKSDSVQSDTREEQIESETQVAQSSQSSNSFIMIDKPTELTDEQNALIRKCLLAKEQYAIPPQEDIAKLTPWPVVSSTMGAEEQQQMFAHITEITILSVQAIVEFTKRLPGFLQLSREDQIVLLKSSAIEVMMLQTAELFDHSSDNLNLISGVSINRRGLVEGGLSEFVDPMFDFAIRMLELELDGTEFTLLMALCILASDRPQLNDRELVEKIQEPYLDTMRTYLKRNRPGDNLVLPKMLMKLTELRTLNNQHSEYLFALKLKDQSLPPLLTEIWDQ